MHVKGYYHQKHNGAELSPESKLHKSWLSVSNSHWN